ncbi:excalibur calcium-binding domain-containing protein [Novosphingobium sp. G106]|uniref:excalibur calcium-binding domain-containing protein n=1 Tax=Novosphingobium sp. G106 TaxID=2849500 RepID=UPI001C2D1395|nr:excalibur calcium-binding domain-containing protein [Novosphingobium sp. G106]MBV1688995.1 excalibur calcium-binding domain-containing protein [Novosphingobium sp. G106]
MIPPTASQGNDQNMGQISVEITPSPGSLLGGNQQRAHRPKSNLDTEPLDYATSPTKYRYTPAEREWGVGKTVLVGVFAGAVIGGAWIALKNDGPARLRGIAVTAGIVRARSPQSGDYWPGCNAARSAGTAPIYANEPGYRPEMDGDNDGVACEPYYGN